MEVLASEYSFSSSLVLVQTETYFFVVD